MQASKLNIIYEDNNVLIADKPSGIDILSLIKLLSKKYPNLRNVHRLDKDTSGVFLLAKNNKSLIFLQKQFKQRKVEKKYIALVVGTLKDNQGEIKTLIGRNPKNRKKQKVFLRGEPGSKGKREAITEYRVIKRFARFNNSTKDEISARRHSTKSKDYTLIEVKIKTGRKHQIRCHFSYLGHPLAGDKKYKFKNQPCPEGLKRQFLHASYIKIRMPDNKEKEFRSGLPDDLRKVLDNLKSK